LESIAPCIVARLSSKIINATIRLGSMSMTETQRRCSSSGRSVIGMLLKSALGRTHGNSGRRCVEIGMLSPEPDGNSGRRCVEIGMLSPELQKGIISGRAFGARSHDRRDRTRGYDLLHNWLTAACSRNRATQPAMKAAPLSFESCK
jgi:hypothetical protein